MPNFFKGVD